LGTARGGLHHLPTARLAFGMLTSEFYRGSDRQKEVIMQ
jgi:hypothetical protein